MTAMLQEMRRLEAARSRGEITPAQYNDIRRRLLNAVEEAQVADSQIGGQRRAPRGVAPNVAGAPGARQRGAATARPGATASGARAATAAGPRMNIWGLVVVLVGLATLATLLLGFVLGDFTIALTLARHRLCRADGGRCKNHLCTGRRQSCSTGTARPCHPRGAGQVRTGCRRRRTRIIRLGREVRPVQ